jgi:hypothetical protein
MAALFVKAAFPVRSMMTGTVRLGVVLSPLQQLIEENYSIPWIVTREVRCGVGQLTRQVAAIQSEWGGAAEGGSRLLK